MLLSHCKVNMQHLQQIIQANTQCRAVFLAGDATTHLVTHQLISKQTGDRTILLLLQECSERSKCLTVPATMWNQPVQSSLAIYCSLIWQSAQSDSEVERRESNISAGKRRAGMRRSQGHEWLSSSQITIPVRKEEQEQHHWGALGKPVQNSNVAKKAERGDGADREGQHLRHCTIGAGAPTGQVHQRYVPPVVLIY